MNKWINIIRYVVSFVLPLFFLSDPIKLFAVFAVLLLLNNCIDDFIFYVGNVFIDQSRYNGGFASPVNGIVTLVESGVKLYNSINKVDPLTYRRFLAIDLCADARSTYNHAAIFLNKFSHHIVINPRKLLKCSCHVRDGSLEEMVIDGKLVGDNNGSYLCNDALILRYSDTVIVLTLDKYVSDYMFLGGKEMQPSTMILRGSQCDIYTKRNLDIKEGDLVEVFQSIGDGDDFDVNDGVVEDVVDAVVNALKRVGGICNILKQNLRKTFSTWSGIIPVVTVFVGCVAYPFNTIITYVAFSWTYYFVWLRIYRHLMYSLMNIIGYKKWMSKSYSIVNKPMQLWQRK